MSTNTRFQNTSALNVSIVHFVTNYPYKGHHNNLFTEVTNYGGENVKAYEVTQQPQSVSYACFCYDFVIEAVFMGVLCLLGLLGNAASVVCLSHDKSRNATPFLLISLAMADTMFLISVFFLRVLSSIHTFGWNLLFVVKTAPYMAKFVYPAALLSQTAAIYLTILVTLNRFMAVCYPYIASDVCSLRNAKFHVSAVVVFSIIFNIPRFFQMDIVCNDDQIFQRLNASSPINLSNSYTVRQSPLETSLRRSIENSSTTDSNLVVGPASNYQITCHVKEAWFVVHPLYTIVYASVAYCLVMFLVPLVSLSFFNVRLVGALRVAKARREKLLLKRKRVENARNKAAVQEQKNHTNQKNQETNLSAKDQISVVLSSSLSSTVIGGSANRPDDDITFMLVVVVMVFVVTQSPALLTQLLYFILNEYERNCPRLFFFFERLSDLLVVANSSLNFVIYCFCSTRFRQILVELMFRRSKRQRGGALGERSKKIELSRSSVSCRGEQQHHHHHQQKQQQFENQNNLTIPLVVNR